MVKVVGPDLKRYMDKRLSLKLNGNRKVTGVLRGFDQFMNVTLDETVEEVSATEQNRIGMVVSGLLLRGIMMLADSNDGVCVFVGHSWQQYRSVRVPRENLIHQSTITLHEYVTLTPKGVGYKFHVHYSVAKQAKQQQQQPIKRLITKLSIHT